MTIFMKLRISMSVVVLLAGFLSVFYLSAFGILSAISAAVTVAWTIAFGSILFRVPAISTAFFIIVGICGTLADNPIHHSSPYILKLVGDASLQPHKFKLDTLPEEEFHNALQACSTEDNAIQRTIAIDLFATVYEFPQTQWFSWVFKQKPERTSCLQAADKLAEKSETFRQALDAVKRSQKLD